MPPVKVEEKPLEAIQFDGGNAAEIAEFFSLDEIPEVQDDGSGRYLMIDQMGIAIGAVMVQADAWIVRGRTVTVVSDEEFRAHWNVIEEGNG